jgi:hypothetical protein
VTDKPNKKGFWDVLFPDGTRYDIAIGDIQRFTVTHEYRQLNRDASLWPDKATRVKWEQDLAQTDADFAASAQTLFEGPPVTVGVEVTYLEGSTFVTTKVAKVQSCHTAHKSGSPICLQNNRSLLWSDTVSIFNSPRLKLSSFLFDPSSSTEDPFPSTPLSYKRSPKTTSASGRLAPSPTPTPTPKKQKLAKLTPPSSIKPPPTPASPSSSSFSTSPSNGKKSFKSSSKTPSTPEEIEKALFMLESQYSNECEAQSKKQFTSRCELELKLADERDAHETKLAQERFAMIQHQSEEQSALRNKHIQGRQALLRQLMNHRKD